MTRHITVPVTVPDEYLGGILTTAVEHAITRWATIATYRWLDIPPAKLRAVIVEHDDDVPRTVTILTITTGLRRVLRFAPGVTLATVGRLRADVAAMLTAATYHSTHLVPTDADAIVQAGLFGEVRHL
jgi:hypothetical protein